jgi:hypothetical protein
MVMTNASNTDTFSVTTAVCLMARNVSVIAPNGSTGILLIKGGKDDVTNVGEVNSRLDFGSNDTSISNEGNIGGRIASVTEFSNGAFAGLSFSTYQQGRSPDLKEALRLDNGGNATIAGALSIGGP